MIDLGTGTQWDIRTIGFSERLLLQPLLDPVRIDARSDDGGAGTAEAGGAFARSARRERS